MTRRNFDISGGTKIIRTMKLSRRDYPEGLMLMQTMSLYGQADVDPDNIIRMIGLFGYWDYPDEIIHPMRLSET